MNNLPTLHEIKMKLVNERLEMFDGNRSQAARSLGIHPASIGHWIEWYSELAHWRGKAKPGNPKLRGKSACRRQYAQILGAQDRETEFLNLIENLRTRIRLLEEENQTLKLRLEEMTAERDELLRQRTK